MDDRTVAIACIAGASVVASVALATGRDGGAIELAFGLFAGVLGGYHLGKNGKAA